MRLYAIITLLFAAVVMTGCDDRITSSDQVQQRQQEQILREGTAQLGMPAIHNFREKRLLKEIMELRDQESLCTYTYIVAENTGALIFIGESIGYGIPAATQYTSPSKIECYSRQDSYAYNVMPQADPNGLFSPSSAEGTWVMLVDQVSKKARPVYIEPRIIVSPFPLK